MPLPRDSDSAGGNFSFRRTKGEIHVLVVHDCHLDYWAADVDNMRSNAFESRHRGELSSIVVHGICNACRLLRPFSVYLLKREYGGHCIQRTGPANPNEVGVLELGRVGVAANTQLVLHDTHTSTKRPARKWIRLTGGRRRALSAKLQPSVGKCRRVTVIVFLSTCSLPQCFHRKQKTSCYAFVNKLTRVRIEFASD